MQAATDLGPVTQSQSRNQLNLQQKNEAMQAFFNGILYAFKEFNLKASSPNVFLIYAHDSKNKNDLPANASDAELLIQWLYELGIDLYSDRRSQHVVFSTQAEKELAMNLLKNQFNILPDDKEKRYQHIILCGSQLLQSHTLKKSKEEPEKSYFDLYRKQVSDVLANDEDIDNKISDLQRELNHYLKEHKDESFHHVLTELAFLKLRCNKADLRSTVIPIILNGSTKMAFPFFITTFNHMYHTKWYLQDEKWKDKEVYEQEGLHGALFQILKCLYVGQEKILKYIEECELAYKNIVEDFRQNKLSKKVVEEALQALAQARQRIQSEHEQTFVKFVHTGLKRISPTALTSEEENNTNVLPINTQPAEINLDLARSTVGRATTISADRGNLRSMEAKSVPILPERKRVLGLPANVRNPFFIKRNDLWQKMELSFEHQTQKQFVASVMHGMGGMGKTELAKIYVSNYTNRAENYFPSVWLDVGKKDFEAEFRRRATEIQKQFNEEFFAAKPELADTFDILKAPIQEVNEHFYHLLDEYGKKHQQNWLVVFDNADEPGILNPFLPIYDRDRGHILITTRQDAWPPNFEKIPVDVFTSPEALQYLKQHFPQEAEEKLANLAEKLSYMPIALYQASAVIKDNDGPDLEAYLAKFEKKKLDYLKRFPASQWSAQEKRATVEAVWESSLEIALKVCAEVKAILTVIAYLDAQQIPTFILKAGWSKAVVKQALTALQSCSLIQWHKKSISIHPLMQDITRLKVASASTADSSSLPSQQVAIAQVFAIMDKAFTYERNHPKGIGQVEDLMPHIRRLFNYLDEFEKENADTNTNLAQNVISLCWKISNYYCFENYSSAKILEYLDRGLHFAKKIDAKNYQVRFNFLLSNIYFLDDKREKAQQLFDETNQFIQQHQLLLEPTDLAVQLLMQGIFLETSSQVNEPEQCLDCYKKAKAIIDKHFSHQARIERFEALFNIAFYLSNKNKDKTQLSLALEYYELALQELDKLYQTERYWSGFIPKSLRRLINTSKLLENKEKQAHYEKQLQTILDKRTDSLSYQLRGNIALEKKLYAEALVYFDKVIALKGSDVDIDNLLDKVEALYGLKNYTQAHQVLEQALHMDSEYHKALNWKGILLFEEKQYEAALAFYCKAREADPTNPGYWSNEASALRQLKRYSEAQVALVQALKLAPNDPITLNEQGLLLDAQDQSEAALASYRQAREADSTIPRYWSNEANALYQLKRYPEAQAALDKALKLAPDDASALNIQGVLFDAQAKPEAALASYRQAREADPTIPRYWSNEANALRKLKRYPEAQAVLDQALKLAPDDASALNEQGVLFDAQAKPEAALASYRQAREADPTIPRYWSNEANALRKLKRYPEAQAALDQALKLAPDDASVLNEQGLLLDAQAKPEAALASFRQAREADPSNPRYWSNEADVLRQLKRYFEAQAALDQALKLASNNASVLNEKGLLLDAQEKWEAALEFYRQAQAADPSDPNCWSNEANALRQLKRYSEAQAALDQALKLAPNDAFALNAQALLLDAQEKWEAALEFYRQAQAADPKESRYWRNEAKVLRKVKRYPQAQEVLNYALKLAPNNPYNLNEQGVLLEEQGQWEIALKFHRKSRINDPTNNPICWSNEVRALRELKRYSEAQAVLDQALVIAPHDPNILEEQGWLLNAQGRWKESLIYFQKAQQFRSGESNPSSNNQNTIGNSRHQLFNANNNSEMLEQNTNKNRDKKQKKHRNRGCILS